MFFLSPFQFHGVWELSVILLSGGLVLFPVVSWRIIRRLFRALVLCQQRSWHQQLKTTRGVWNLDTENGTSQRNEEGESNMDNTCQK